MPAPHLPGSRRRAPPTTAVRLRAAGVSAPGRRGGARAAALSASRWRATRELVSEIRVNLHAKSFARPAGSQRDLDSAE